MNDQANQQNDQIAALDPLTLANKITKALYPDIYGKPGISMEQAMMLMGARGIIEEAIKAALAGDDR